MGFQGLRRGLLGMKSVYKDYIWVIKGRGIGVSKYGSLSKKPRFLEM